MSRERGLERDARRMTGGRRRARHDDAPIGRAFADAAPGIARVPRRLHRSRRSSAKPNLLAKPGRRPSLRRAASPDIAATRARGGRTRIVDRCGDPTCRHPGYPAIGPTPPPSTSPRPRHANAPGVRATTKTGGVDRHHHVAARLSGHATAVTM
ncbi:hypothetical protein BURPS305_6045 [Burkholderia pseudomallei 305]|nr:hypothetical protein BURPS305_6045 [Burkholderia pseudomallei 305]